MRSTLLVIPAEVLGIPVWGVGWAMLLIAHVTLIALAVRLRTVGWDADARGIAVWGAVGTVVVGWVIPSILGTSGFPIRGYGVFLLLAILAAGGILAWRRHRIGASWDTIVSISLWSLLGGIAGARLFYVVEYSSEIVVRDAGTQSIALGATLWNALNVTGGGLVVYGGLLGGTAVALAMLVHCRLPILRSCDTIIPAVVIAMAIGRIGCLMHGCCYGDVCSPEYAEYGIVFPVESPAHYGQLERGLVEVSSGQVLPVYPTQLYSAAVLAILGVMLLGFSSWIGDRCDGAVFAAFLLLEPPSRFVLEIFRADEGDFLGTGMTVGQNVAIGLFLAGVLLTALLLTRRISQCKQQS